jgi:predicted component of type VI protein secretion system
MPPDKTGPFLTDPSGREHSLPAQAILGRATECTIVVVHRSVSREHARIRADGRRWRLEDLGSTNGTFLNNERIIVPVQLRDGDRLSIGDVEFVFHDPDTTQRETPLPTLELDLARAAGPYKAGLQTVPMPEYDRYEGDLAELAAAVRGERPLSVTLDQELLVQRWLLKACEMS